MDALAQDLRYALRLLWRHPGLTLIAIVTLALGIGANTAIFSVIDAVLLRPLPYPEPHRLVQFHRELQGRLQGEAHDGRAARFLLDQPRAYSHRAAFMSRGDITLVQEDRAESFTAAAVSPGYFDTLGVPPALGRSFDAAEALPGGADAVVLSHALWQRVFHGDRNVLQQAILLGGTPHQVVGIMPEGFVTRPATDVWIPLRPGPHDNGFNLGVVARLAPGVTVAQAEGELDALRPAWLEATGIQPRATLRLRLRPFQGNAGAALTTPLIVLMAAVALVLVIACANLANLLLARATTRQREMAVRATLGASRGRLVRQLLIESLVLAGAGGIAGLLLARVTLPGLLAISPVDPAFWGEIGLDGRVLAFAAMIAVATGLLFGLAPALAATRLDLSQGTRDGMRTTGGRRTGLLRQVLIVGEVAVSLALLVGALLLVRTFFNLVAIAPGFDPTNVLVARMAMSTPRYDTAARVSRFYRTALDRLRQLPEVESAAVILNAPMGTGMNVPFTLPASGTADKIEITDWRYVTPDYFRVMRTPLIAGRAFGDADTATSPRVAIVNQQFARRFFPDRDPIGQHVRLFAGREERARDLQAGMLEIVGVAADMSQRVLQEPPPPMVYVPVDQTSDGSLRMAHVWFPTHWIVRGRSGTTGLPDALSRTLRDLDPQQPFGRIQTLSSLIDRSLAAQRFHMLLIGACALLAVVLAAAGLFGVIAYAVAQRGPEMGVRLALGATVGQLVGSVVRDGLQLAAMGVALGLAAAFVMTRLLQSFLFGISATDPLTFVAAAVLLLALAVLASVAPALRLMRLDPAAVLRGR